MWDHLWHRAIRYIMVRLAVPCQFAVSRLSVGWIHCCCFFFTGFVHNKKIENIENHQTCSKGLYIKQINILYECNVFNDTGYLCYRKSSWHVFPIREVDRMWGLWSAACSPVNHAQGRGAPLGERAFIFCWQGRTGRTLNTLCSLRYGTSVQLVGSHSRKHQSFSTPRAT